MSLSVHSCWDIDALLRRQTSKSSILDAWQKQQVTEFSHRGFPYRDEHWKYTSVQPLTRRFFDWMPESRTSLQYSPVLENVYLIVFVNGFFRSDLSDLKKLPSEVCIFDMHTALVQNVWPTPDQLALNEKQVTPFSLLNDALFRNGLVVWVPAEVVLEYPIYCLHITDKNAMDGMHHGRNIVTIGKNAKAVVVEDYIGAEDVIYFNNVVTQVEIQEGAELHYYKIQREGNAAFHFGYGNIHQKRNSLLRSYQITVGGQLSREDLNIQLEQQGATCHLLGFYGGVGSNLVDHHTQILHQASYSSSDQKYKGLIRDEAGAVFNGKIFVHPQTTHIQAAQLNRNVLLSPTAFVNSKPELEIYADDVQCTHGATVGELDPAALFYLRSRGLTATEARFLLIDAFIQEILGECHNLEMAEGLRLCITQWLMRG